MTRLLSRGLLVLGGTVAATATAWLISSATASADPLLPDAPGITHGLTDAASGVTGTVGTLAAPVGHTVTSTITNTAGSTVGAVLDPSAITSIPAAVPTSAAGLAHVTGSLNSTVHQLHLADLPDPATVATSGLARALPVATPSAPHQAAAPQTAPQLPVAAAPAHAPALSGTPLPVSGPRLVPAATDRRPVPAHELGEHHSAGGLPGSPGAPVPHPFGPLTAPVAPGSNTGTSGPQGPNGPSLGEPSGLPAFPGLDVVRVPAPADVPAPTMPGKQPGTTPD